MDVNWNLTSCHMHTAVSYSLFSATLPFFASLQPGHYYNEQYKSLKSLLLFNYFISEK